MSNLPKGRDHIWQMMREQTRSSGSFTLTSIWKAQNGSTQLSISRWIKRWHEVGAIEICAVETLPHGVQSYSWRVLASYPMPTDKFSRAQHARQNMWNALRASRSWLSVDQLMAGASTDDLTISKPVCRVYLSDLASGGYLKTGRDGHFRVYRLYPQRNTGPLAPSGRTKAGIYDFNLKRSVNVTALSQQEAA
jgi:hypothetical protein